MADDLEALLARIAAKREQIRRAPPLPAESLASWLDDYGLRQAHATTALEGNTLTLHEAQEVLEHGTTIPGKLLREHIEVVNAHATWQWLSRRDPHAALSEAFVRETHRRLMQGILGEEAGWYRRAAVFIRGSRHVPPNWVKVPELMAQWVDRYAIMRPLHLSPVVWAARGHIELAAIHPFLDGNGRTCRLVASALLMQADYPPALYEATVRREYMQALERAQVSGDDEPFIRVTAAAAEVMLDRCWLLMQQGPEG